MTSARRHTSVGVVSAVAVLVIWSSFILIGRLNATGAHTLLPLDIAFLRFVFSGLGVLAIASVRVWRAPPGRSVRRAALGPLTVGQIAALGGFAGVGYCSLAYTGFFFAPAAHASVLMTGSLPLWTAIVAWFVVREPFTRASLVAVLLIIAGDALVAESSLRVAFTGGGVWRGDLCFLGASMMWAAYTVSCRKWQVGPLDATVAIGVSCLVTFVPVYALAAAAGWWPSHLADAGWREIGFQIMFQAGFAMLIAGPAFTQVIASFGAVRAAMLTALVPVISALAAVAILGEPLGVLASTGLVCVTAGFVVSVWASRQPVGRPS
jgi:drug/metabolite transporter (DMT)-like permease